VRRSDSVVSKERSSADALSVSCGRSTKKELATRPAEAQIDLEWIRRAHHQQIRPASQDNLSTRHDYRALCEARNGTL